MITKHTGQKSLFVSFCLNLAWNLAVTQQVAYELTGRSTQSKIFLILYFFLKHFFIPEHPHRCRLLHFYVWDINKIGFVKIFFRDHNCVKTRITSLLQVFSLLK